MGQRGARPRPSFSCWEVLTLCNIWQEIEIKSKHAKVLEASPRNLSADSIGTLAIGAVASALTDEKYDAVDQRKIMDSLRSTLGTEGRERAEEVLQAVCEGM